MSKIASVLMNDVLSLKNHLNLIAFTSLAYGAVVTFEPSFFFKLYTSSVSKALFMDSYDRLLAFTLMRFWGISLITIGIASGLIAKYGNFQQQRQWNNFNILIMGALLWADTQIIGNFGATMFNYFVHTTLLLGCVYFAVRRAAILTGNVKSTQQNVPAMSVPQAIAEATRGTEGTRVM